MALKKCKECGGQVSSSAAVCPHCGKKQAKMGCGTIVVICIFGFLTLPIFGQIICDQLDGYDRTKTSVEKHTPQSKSKFLSANQLMVSAQVEYEAAIQMGAYAQEYLNKYKYLNKIVTLKDIIYAIYPASAGKQTRVDFSAGPCLVDGGNVIRCYMSSDEKIKEPGQEITISGKLTEYGRFRLAREANIRGCGYYIVLRTCKVVQ